ncbi:PAAR domain-containing protein [Sphingomonas sp. Leaf242]|uniref:PAAR domain-containing protein n=1 Tax=Sphingomonas sp. Leaf242 TaxID=1736304 RepID=UPI000712B946|nr:PAAR domain-containing protein [Sphingomonas sp. Leaf242]KQO12764.1 hypothetical protein ASF09_00080 [Sphingomonas sp. Leaf242]
MDWQCQRAGLVQIVEFSIDLLEAVSSGNCLQFNDSPWLGSIIVRKGSATVFINGRPASRLKSMLTCGAHIKTASPNVFIGGETVRTGFVFDLEAWTRSGLQILGIGAAVGAGAFAAMAGVAAFGTFAGIGALGFAGMEGVGMVGDAIEPGYRDLVWSAWEWSCPSRSMPRLM